MTPRRSGPCCRTRDGGHAGVWTVGVSDHRKSKRDREELSAHLVPVSSDCSNVWRNSTKVVERLTVADVARHYLQSYVRRQSLDMRARFELTDDLLDLTRQKQFLELCRKVVASIRNVKIPNDKDEHWSEVGQSRSDTTIETETHPWQQDSN
jgi:hypothetical protein